jgi:hypothetical protein
VFGPNLLKDRNESVMTMVSNTAAVCQAVLLLAEHYETVFLGSGEVVIERGPPPPASAATATATASATQPVPATASATQPTASATQPTASATQPTASASATQPGACGVWLFDSDGVAVAVALHTATHCHALPRTAMH